MTESFRTCKRGSHQSVGSPHNQTSRRSARNNSGTVGAYATYRKFLFAFQGQYGITVLRISNNDLLLSHLDNTGAVGSDIALRPEKLLVIITCHSRMVARRNRMHAQSFISDDDVAPCAVEACMKGVLHVLERA